MILPSALLCACGGGDNESSATVSTAATTATASAAPVRVQPPRVRGGLVALATSPADGSIVVADDDGSVRLLNGDDGETRRLLAAPSSRHPAGVAFVQQGRRVVAVGRDSEAQVWDVASGESLARLRGAEQPLRATATSADGRVLAVGGEDARVLVWNGETGRLSRVLTGSEGAVDALAASADGRWLAAGNARGAVVLWRVADGQVVAARKGAHADDVDAVAFSPSGAILASAGRDGKVLLWSTASSSAFETPRVLVTGGPAWRAIAFSPDGRTLAAGDVRGRVALWDLGGADAAARGSASPARTVTVEASPVNALVFSARADGALFVAHESRRLMRVDAATGVAR